MIMKLIKILSVVTVALLATVTVSAHERGAPKDVGKDAIYECENFVAPDVAPIAIDLPAVNQVYEPVMITAVTASDNAWLENYISYINPVRYRRSSESLNYTEAPANIEYAPLKYRRSNNKTFALPVAATAAMPGQNGEPPSPIKPVSRE